MEFVGNSQTVDFNTRQIFWFPDRNKTRDVSFHETANFSQTTLIGNQ